MHFKEEDFAYRLDSSLKRILKTDEVGISVFPTIHAKREEVVQEPLDFRSVERARM